MLLLRCYYYVTFFSKKSNQKNKNINTNGGNFGMPLWMTRWNIPAYIFLSFDHTQSPPFCVQILFFFYIVLFYGFFIILPWSFRRIPSIPYIFLFFSFQKRAVFLFLQEKSTRRQHSCGSRTYNLHYYNSSETPDNGA